MEELEKWEVRPLSPRQGKAEDGSLIVARGNSNSTPRVSVGSRGVELRKGRVPWLFLLDDRSCAEDAALFLVLVTILGMMTGS